MTLYTPASAAEPLSEALYALSRPPQVRDGNDTRYLFGWVTCTDGSRWLQVDTAYDIPVHPQAELGEIAAILQPWIDEGHLPADTNTQLAALVDSVRGGRLVVWEAFPQLFKDLSQTREQLVEAGILEEPNLEP
jgi:hypothetical protein